MIFSELVRNIVEWHIKLTPFGYKSHLLIFLHFPDQYAIPGSTSSYIPCEDSNGKKV